MMRARGFIGLAAVAALVAAFDSSAAASARSPAGAGLTAAQLATDLTAGAQIRNVPGDLEPPLDVAGVAEPIIVRNGCHLSRTGLRSKPCVYGDTTSTTTVVLFGDSHAAYWFPALDLISQEQHWRLVDLTKDGCPVAEVNIAAWFSHWIGPICRLISRPRKTLAPAVRLSHRARS